MPEPMHCTKEHVTNGMIVILGVLCACALTLGLCAANPSGVASTETRPS